MIFSGLVHLVLSNRELCKLVSAMKLLTVPTALSCMPVVLMLSVTSDR